MKTWWHEEAGERVGPVDVQELRARLMTGRLSWDTLAWKAGMETWRPLAEIEDLHALWAPPPLPSTFARNIPTPQPAKALAPSEPLAPSELNSGTAPAPAATESPAAELVSTTRTTAGKWKRFLARSFDVGWEGILVVGALSFLVGYLSVELGLATVSGVTQWSRQPGNLLLVALACFPITLAFDAVVYTVLGNTPGKALLGLRVINFDGKPLNFLAYAQRNARMWFSGYALGLPLLSLFTVAWQAYRLDRGEPAYYDLATCHRIQAYPLSRLHWVAFTCLSLALCAANSFAIAFGVSSATQVPAVAAAQAPLATSAPVVARSAPAINPDKVKRDGIFWENPLTHKTVVLEPNWTPTAHTDKKGGPVTIFREPSNRAVLQLTQDRVTLGSLAEYAKAYQKRFARDVKFSGSGYAVYDKGRPVWVMYGNPVSDANQEIRVELTKRGNRIWCLVSVKNPRDMNATWMLYKLRAAIKESIS